MTLSSFKKKWGKQKTDGQRKYLLQSLFNGFQWTIFNGKFDNELFRITRWEDIPMSIDKISYPPKAIIKDYGRANRPFVQMLYLSLHPYSPIQELNITTEEKFVLSTWECKEDIRIIELAGEIRGKDDSKITTTGTNKKSKEILQYFSDLFTKESSVFYKLTANISDFLLIGLNDKNLSPFDGILYPSVKSKYLRENLVVKSETADKAIKLKKAVYGSIKEFKNENSECVFVSTHRTKEIKSDGYLIWEETEGKEELLIIERK